MTLGPKFPHRKYSIFALSDQAAFSTTSLTANVLLARWLGEFDFGIFALSSSLLLFVLGFQNSLVLEPMSVFGTKNYSRSLGSYYRWLTRRYSILSVVGTLFTALFLWLFFRSWLTSSGWAFLVSLPFVFQIWYLRRFAYVLGRPLLAFVVSALYGLSFVGLLLLLESFGAITLWTTFLSSGASSLLAGFTGFALLGKLSTDTQPHEFQPEDAMRNHLRYGKWASATNIVHWLGGSIYVPLTAAFVGVEDAGAFRAVQILAAPMGQIVTALSALYLPFASRLKPEHSPEILKRVAIGTGMLFGGVAVAYSMLLFVSFDRVIGLLFTSDKFVNAAPLLPFVLIASVLSAIASAFSLLLRAADKPRSIFVASFGAALITTTVAVVLVSRFALDGLAISLVLTSLTLLTMLLLGFRNVYKSAMRISGLVAQDE